MAKDHICNTNDQAVRINHDTDANKKTLRTFIDFHIFEIDCDTFLLHGSLKQSE